MSKSMQCGECQSRFKFQEKHAGKTVKCPGCGKPVKIPAVEETTEHESFSKEKESEDDWSWDNTEDDSSWASMAGSEGDSADDEESRPLPPRTGQKRRTGLSTGSAQTKSDERPTQASSGLRGVGVFCGGAAISITLTLIAGLMIPGSSAVTREANGAIPVSSNSDETAIIPSPDSTTVAGDPVRLPTEETVTTDSKTASSDSEKQAAVRIESELLSLPLYMGHIGVIGETGILAGISDGKLVGLKSAFFEGDDKSLIGPVEIPGSQVATLLSRRFEDRTILLATDLASRIHELNPETFEILRSAELFLAPAEQPGAKSRETPPKQPSYIGIVSSSNSSDPYVYVRRGDSASIENVQAVDLRTFQILDGPDVTERVVGSTVTPLGDSPLDRNHHGVKSTWFDPHGRFAVTQSVLVDLVQYPDSGQVVQSQTSTRSERNLNDAMKPMELSFQPLCWIDNGRWIIGIKAEQAPARLDGVETKANPVFVCFVSPDTFETVAEYELPNAVEIPLPNAAQQAAGRSDSQAGRTIWQSADGSLREVAAWDDPKGKRLIMVCRKTAMAVPYDVPGLPQRPILAIQNRHTECLVNEKLSFDVQPVEEQTEVLLVEFPKGMTMKGSLLEWVPSQDDIGSHIIRLRATRNGFERMLAVNVSVTNPTIQWRGSNRGTFTVSADGKLGMAVMEPDERGGTSDCALFDLSERKLITEKSFPGRIYSVNIGSKYFVALRESREPGNSDIETLVGTTDTLEVQRTIPSRLAGIQLVADRYVYPLESINNQLGHSGSGGFDLEVKNSTWPVPDRFGEASSVSRLGFQTTFGYVHGGVYRDAKDHEPSLLLGIPEVFSINGFQPKLDRGMSHAPLNSQGLRVNRLIRNALFSQISLASDICHRAQVRLQVVQHEPHPDRPTVEDTFYLVAIDLKTREIVRRWMVLRQAASPYRFSTGSALAVHGDTAWVIVGRRLQKISLAELPDQSPALQIDLSTAPLLLDTQKKTNVLSYSVSGDREPLQTRLVFMDCGNEMAQFFVTQGDKPGEFRVDGPAVLNAIFERRSLTLSQQFRSYGADEVPWISTYKDRATAYLKSVLDYSPKDVPFTTTLQFSVTDANGDTEELIHQVVIEIPAEDVDKKLRADLPNYGELHKK